MTTAEIHRFGARTGRFMRYRRLQAEPRDDRGRDDLLLTIAEHVAKQLADA